MSYNMCASPSHDGEWESIFSSVPEGVAACVRDIVDENRASCAAAFYQILLSNAEAAPLLTQEIVSQRLNRSLQGWLSDLFCWPPKGDFPALSARQRQVGEVHARIRVPMHLVARGGRILKAELARHLEKSALDRSALAHALRYVDTMIDVALEIMGQAFIQNTRRGIQMDEAYRLFSLGQDVTLERETQRAALLEWSHEVLFELYSGTAENAPSSLGRSEFGLWLHHKASILFQGQPLLEQIRAAMSEIDTAILPALVRSRGTDEAAFAAELAKLQTRISEMRFLLTNAFQSIANIENGRDPLTRTLNRRFLPSIMGREIAIATRDHSSFAVLMIDVDHFKQVNDRWGHAGGDVVLQQIAHVILESCRISDFVFRYGGEEFLVILVDAGEQGAVSTAERIRQSIEQHDINLPDKSTTRISASIGVAVFDGHPDYARLVNRADTALYRAKNAGRNRVVLADAQSTADA